MVWTIVKGDEAMLRGTSSMGVGLAIHAALSVLYGALFGLAMPRLRTNGTVAIAGTIYGALLFVVNFIYIAPLAFYAFDKANYPFELFAHLVYGLLVAFAFFGSASAAVSPSSPSSGVSHRWARDGAPRSRAAPRKLRR